MIDDDPNPNSIEIVSLTPERVEAYKAIRLRGLLEDPQAFGRSYEEEKVFPQEKWLERASNPYNFMAIEDGVPLGTMGAFLSDESGDRIANIVGVFVSKESRGKGVGSKLLSAVLDKIKEDPAIRTARLSVNKDQTPAVKLYEKYGFQITGEETHKMGDGKDHTEYHMELTL